MEKIKLNFTEIDFILHDDVLTNGCEHCRFKDYDDCDAIILDLTRVDCAVGYRGHFRKKPNWSEIEDIENVEVGMETMDATGIQGEVIGTDDNEELVFWKTVRGDVFWNPLNVLKFRK